MSVKNLSSSYDEIYEAVSKIPQQKDEKEVDFFSSLIPNDHKYCILDLGCAEGKLAIKLASMGHEVVASDISENYLEQTFNRACFQGIQLKVVRCDIENDISCFNDEYFDFIFLTEVIEHLRSPIRGLENLALLLKPNGSLFISTPNACSTTNLVNHLLRGNKVENLKRDEIWSLHFQIFDLSTLTKLCNFSGLDVKRIIPTRFRIPGICYSRLLARLFPSLCGNILLECKRSTEPLNVIESINDW